MTLLAVLGLPKSIDVSLWSVSVKIDGILIELSPWMLVQEAVCTPDNIEAGDIPSAFEAVVIVALPSSSLQLVLPRGLQPPFAPFRSSQSTSAFPTVLNSLSSVVG